jgi:hypothetical protein
MRGLSLGFPLCFSCPLEFLFFGRHQSWTVGFQGEGTNSPQSLEIFARTFRTGSSYQARMRLRFVFMAVAMLAAGCTRATSIPKPGNNECRQKAEALGTSLRALDHSYGIVARHVELPVRDDLPLGVPPRWTLLELSAEGAWTDDQGMDSSSEAIAALSRTGVPLIAVDEDTPWQRMTEVLRELDANKTPEVTFVFRRTLVRPPPPPPSALDAKLDAIASGPNADRAADNADVLGGLIVDCAPLGEAFGAVAREPPESRTDKLIAALPAALIACDCRCDVDALHGLLHRSMQNDFPTSTLTLPLDRQGPELRFAPGTPWKEVSRALAPGRRLAH